MSTEKRFCPNCGSTWVEPDTENRAETAFTGGNPNMWHCRECDYTGIMPEGDPDADYDNDGEPDIEFANKSVHPRLDTGFGQTYRKYLIYVFLLLTAFYISYRFL